MLAPLLILVFQAPAEPADPHVIAVEDVDRGTRIGGADYLLVAAAARHPAMRSANLACYNIHVYNSAGVRRVAFVARTIRTKQEKTADGTDIIFLPADPNCHSISFEMNRRGRVARVIYSRD
jgi:hypothetical protein